MKKYNGLKRVTVGLLFFLQNFHIEIKGILVSIMPDFIGIALIFIGLFEMRTLSTKIKRELPILAIDFIINTFVFFLNLYISILRSKDEETHSYLVATYSAFGTIKGVLSCFIIYSIFHICKDICIKENVNKRVYSKCPHCMWSYMILFFINIILSVVTLIFPDSFMVSDSIMMIPNLFISIWAVMICVHIHDALIQKNLIEDIKMPEQVQNLIDNCNDKNIHNHLDDL